MLLGTQTLHQPSVRRVDATSHIQTRARLRVQNACGAVCGAMSRNVRLLTQCMLWWLHTTMTAALQDGHPQPTPALSPGVQHNCPSSPLRINDNLALHDLMSARLYTTNTTWPVTAVPESMQATVGERATFHFSVDASVPEAQTRVHVTFIGPSLFAATNVRRSGPHAYEVEYVAPDVGHFQVHVDLYQRHSVPNKARSFHWAPLQGSPFSLNVLPKLVAVDTAPELTHTETTCEITWPQTVCDDAVLPGRYVPCDPHATDVCLPGGWTWLPFECHHAMHNAMGLRQQGPVWVLFLGSSILRGVFYSAVDILLGNNAQNLTGAGWFKCWNQLDLVSGLVRLTYQDFRPEWVFNPPKAFENIDPSTIRSYKDFRQSLLGNLGREDYHGTAGPDLVVYELAHASGVRFVDTMVSWFGKDWNGQVIAVPRLRNPWHGLFPASVTSYGDVTDPRAKVTDWLGMDLPFIHDMEVPPNVGVTYHYHRRCPDGGQRHVCGTVTDVVMHAVLSKALASTHRRSQLPLSASPSGFTFCLSCPRRDGHPKHVMPWFLPSEPLQCFHDQVPKDLLG